MKTASPALQALLNWSGGATPLIRFALWSFFLRNGQRLLYTTADFPIQAPSSDIWNAPAVDGSGSLWTAPMTWMPQVIDSEDTKVLAHWKLGLDSDTASIKFAPRMIDPVTGATYPDTIGSTPWLTAARAGLLDYADVIYSRAYFSAMPSWPMPLAGAIPVGTLILFRGTVGPVDLASSAAFVTVNDYKAILQEQLPVNIYQAPCRNLLFDAHCTLSATGYTSTGTVATGSSQTVIVATVTAPAGSKTFTGGTMTFTSGGNAGLSVQVIGWSGGLFSLLEPLPFAVAVGDAFSVTAGCDKTTTTCAMFGNSANFGGEPNIPIPEVTLG